MARVRTYNPEKLPALREWLERVNERFKQLGYGSRAAAARYLIRRKHQTGSEKQVGKKVSYLLSGYIRGIHPTLKSGGVWKPEEAERILILLERWLNSKDARVFPLTTNNKESYEDRTLIEDDEF